VETVETPFVADQEKQQDAACHPKTQPDQIDEAVCFVTAQISDRDDEVVADHDVRKLAADGSPIETEGDK
jgi:hypothetical protein